MGKTPERKYRKYAREQENWQNRSGKGCRNKMVLFVGIVAVTVWAFA